MSLHKYIIQYVQCGLDFSWDSPLFKQQSSICPHLKKWNVCESHPFESFSKNHSCLAGRLNGLKSPRTEIIHTQHCTFTLCRSALGVCFLAWERQTHAAALREICLTEAQKRERQLSWVLFLSRSSISCRFHFVERHSHCLLDDCCVCQAGSRTSLEECVMENAHLCVCVCVYEMVFKWVYVKPVSSTAVFM